MPGNAAQRQTVLLKMLTWFSRWKELHDERVEEKHATGYNFFANETWFCIKSLLLGHVTIIQLYCVMNGESNSPQTMNTDTMECVFGDACQMVGGSSNELTVAGFDRLDKKASTFNYAKFLLLAITLQDTMCLVGIRDFSSFSLLVITTI